MIILDTNVLSELTREKPDERVLAWVQAQRSSDLVTTSITKAEIFYGLENMDSGKKRDAITNKTERLFSKHFRGKVLPFDDGASRCYARIGAAATKIGFCPGRMDTMIASIAIMTKARVATRNEKDFVQFPLEVVNPWAIAVPVPNAENSASLATNSSRCGSIAVDG